MAITTHQRRDNEDFTAILTLLTHLFIFWLLWVSPSLAVAMSPFSIFSPSMDHCYFWYITINSCIEAHFMVFEIIRLYHLHPSLLSCTQLPSPVLHP
jgi:hypothetical protein